MMLRRPVRSIIFLGETVPPRDGAHAGTAQLPRVLGGDIRQRLRELCGESIHCLTLLTGRAAPEPGKLRAAVKLRERIQTAVHRTVTVGRANSAVPLPRTRGGS